MNKNIYRIIAVVVFLALGVGAGWYFLSLKSAAPEQQTETVQSQPQNTIEQTNINSDKIDTSDWEIYRNKKYGYEIKYPKGTLVKAYLHRSFMSDLENYLGMPEELRKTRNREIGGNLLWTAVTVDKEEEENPRNLSIHDWVNDVHRYRAAAPDFEKDFNFQGTPAYYTEDYISNLDRDKEDKYKHIEFSIFFFRNGYVYEIFGIKLPAEATNAWKNHPYYSYMQKYIPISEAIINSFKFMDAN